MIRKLLTLTAVAALGAGCLTRQVVSGTPVTHEVVHAEIRQQGIDTVDLLFAIDNSASMGDKQDLLAAAVPVLVGRLLNPNCVVTSIPVCQTTSDCSSFRADAECDASANGGVGRCFVGGDNGGVQQCASIAGTQPEFQPVHDMHIGIVSSSLGGGGSPDICVPLGSSDPTHQDDHGHLLNRTFAPAGNDGAGGDGPPVANAKPVNGDGGSFLAWLPASFPQNVGTTPPNVTPYTQTSQETNLVVDFQSLVEGVQQHGCGLEAQLESWYRFLIQPDPWQSIVLTSDDPPRAQPQDIDATLLKMRHDFLRPDSLVAIIQVTDEEDSWSDPLWLGEPGSGGYGWVARTNDHIPGAVMGANGAAARGTSECSQPVNVNDPLRTGPNNPDCASCMFPNATKPVSGELIGQDVNCNTCPDGTTTGCPQRGWYAPASLATPIVDADGVNVRYSRQTMRKRYGYDNQWNYQRYVDGLRSTTVPDRFNEGVNGSGPHDASNYSPNRNCINPLFADSLSDGSDTSQGALCQLTPGPRTPDLVFYAIIGGVPNELLTDANGNFKLNLSDADWVAILGKDPDHYVFDGIDPHMIQSTAPRAELPVEDAPPSQVYNLGSDPVQGREWNTLTSAAGIDLEYACTFDLPVPKDCTQAVNTGACDCTGSAPDGTPLCSPASRTLQLKGKAYPQSRYQLVAKALGPQAVVASLCAQVVTGSPLAPNFGYNGAMGAIVSRLRAALSGQCLPQPLPQAADGTVACSVLVEYPTEQQAVGCTDPGMTTPDPAVLARFLEEQGLTGSNQGPPLVCEYQQLGGNCQGSGEAGWCYVSGLANTGGVCQQTIRFGQSGPPSGTIVDLECIEH